MSLTGPAGEASASTASRSLTQSEKIDAFVSYIVDNEIVSGAEPTVNFFQDIERQGKLWFYDETILVRRVSVNSEETCINLWVEVFGELDSFERRLFLLEGQAIDGRVGVRGFSSYSNLLLLADESRGGLSSARTPLDRFARDDKAEQLFAADPFEFLTSLGAKIGPPQNVRSIYLKRAFCFQSPGGFPNPEHQLVVGYPIIIERA